MHTRSTIISLFAVVSLLALAEPARAALVISSAPTNFVTCVAGVCTATAANAVLNAGNLQTMLASGDVTVATGTVTNDIKIATPVTWASTSRLTLDARRTLHIDKMVRATGMGAITLITNDGGSGGDFIFSGPGHIEFWDLTSSLIVNGTSYMLVGDVALLASAATANPSGAYALANSYDAMPDGTYTMAPVNTFFAGRFEGLGNTITRLKIDINVQGVTIDAGLFSVLDNGSLVRDLNLTHASVKLHITGQVPDISTVGVLAGDANGQIAYVTTSGTVKTNIADPVATGGLVGHMANTVVRDSRSDATVDGRSRKRASFAGGLIGWVEFGTVLRSAATGDVTSEANIQGADAGGLFGRADGVALSQSWATGAATATGLISAMAGGLIGQQLGGTAADCYANGNALATVSSHNAFAGGLIGYNSGSTSTAISSNRWLAASPPSIPSADTLWGWISGLAPSERASLLAHCVAMSVDAVWRRDACTENLREADQLAQVPALDMAAWWRPTRENFLGSVSKARIVRAVTEGVSATEGTRVASLKKADMAERAETLLAAASWLPEPLRAASVDEVREE